MKKLKAFNYGALLAVCLLFTVGCEPSGPGWAKVNFVNGLEYTSGKKFTARLACDEASFESYTGQLSNCKSETQFCNCELYLDGDYVGEFRGCKDMADYCEDDATLILGLDGSDVALYYRCVSNCGDPISETGDILESYDILDSFFMEDMQEELEMYLNDN